MTDAKTPSLTLNFVSRGPGGVNVSNEALDDNGEAIGSAEEYSVGGGALLSEPSSGEIYGEANAAEILEGVERHRSPDARYC